MMDCFVPVKPTKFELAIQEELPEFYETAGKMLSEQQLDKYFMNLLAIMVGLSALEDVYDKQGREGFRNLRKTQILADAAHENAHED